jgi:hypothetical protein
MPRALFTALASPSGDKPARTTNNRSNTPGIQSPCRRARTFPHQPGRVLVFVWSPTLGMESAHRVKSRGQACERVQLLRTAAASHDALT